MDDRKLPILPSAPRERTDAAAAPADAVCEGSSIIYFVSAEEVSEGFAIALRAMGFGEILPADLVAQCDTTSNQTEG